MENREFCLRAVDCVSTTFSAGIRLTGPCQVTNTSTVSLARTRSGWLAPPGRRIGQFLRDGDRPHPFIRITEAGWGVLAATSNNRPRNP